MRVAVTVEQSWHKVPGGIAVATVELLRALTLRDGLELVGVAAWHRDAPRADVTPPVPVVHLPLPRRALYGSWQWLRTPKIERATGPVDVVHDTAYVVPPSDAPLVATVHDLLFLTYPDHYTPRSLTVLRRGLELARRDARLVMCPSRATAQACRDAGIEEERLRVVPWGVRVGEADSENPEAVLRRYGIDRPFVLFCGTIEPRKNLQRVIGAFREIDRPDVRLVLAGPMGWREDIQAEVDDLGERVIGLGFVPRGDLETLYERAALVAYPSLAEGFGLPVLEAMAMGAAVITSRGTATEEVAGGTALLVDPLDTAAIAAAMDRLLDDRELAARLGSDARERARSYTWTRSAEQAAAVYAEAVRSNG